MTETVTVCEVGPRDGLQNDAVTLAPAVRVQLCERLLATGLAHLEAGSFVSATRVPQMAGAGDVVAGLAAQSRSGAVISALALNPRGARDALAAGVDELHLAYPLTDTFAQRNQGMTVAQAAEATAQTIAVAHGAGVPVIVTLAVAFGCPFEGAVDPGRVSDHAGRMAAAGADAIMLADTVGVGVPAQVRQLVPAAAAAMDGRPVGLHLHNTRNTGYANAICGLEHGVSILDASIGGLGGCPFAPRATGNIATEDLVYLLDGEGVAAGVRIDELIEVSRWLAGVLERDLPGLVHRAGLP